MPTTALIMWEHERDLVKLRTVEVYMTATMTMTWIWICWQKVSPKMRVKVMVMVMVDLQLQHRASKPGPLLGVISDDESAESSHPEDEESDAGEADEQWAKGFTFNED